jgi:uridine kinase
LYWLWKVGRISVEVLIAFFGVALFVISAFSPASLGWMLWGLPLMFMNLAKERKSRVQLIVIQAIFLLYSMSNGIEIRSVVGQLRIIGVTNLMTNVLFTSGMVLVVIFSYSSLRSAILHGDRYKISIAPLTVSIAGDSGTGKDTLAQALTKMFTPNTATILCGDDYHKYERGDVSWENITHLNPAANYLDLWARDYKLAHQRMLFEQREYDHQSGKFSQLKPRYRRDLLVSPGLHGLYTEISMKSDLKIFLTMDQELRIKLKIARDSVVRGQARKKIFESINNRQKDYELFVSHQIKYCDLHFHLYERAGEVNLKVMSGNSYFLEKIMLSMGDFLEITYEEDSNQKSKIYDLRPNGIGGNTLSMVLKHNLNDYDQLFLDEPEIPGGALGVMAILSILLLATRRDDFNV